MRRWLSRLDRIRERTDDVLVRRVRFHAAQIFRDGLAGDGDAVAVEQAGVEQHLHQRRQPADPREVNHAVFAGRLEVGETGTRLPILVKSSIESFTPAQWAIARRCSTALVEPPSAIVTVIAFSNAFSRHDIARLECRP